MERLLLGVDIGGTKCAVVLGAFGAEVYERVVFPTRTDLGVDHTLGAIGEAIERIVATAHERDATIVAAGVSCGGPLDSRRGLILSPPNLPGWDGVPVVRFVREKVGRPVTLLNDADAGALAEHRFGAGRGAETMVFLTFGTGMGAGLVLGGRLFSGSIGLAGEVGHVRVAEDGPDRYGKRGSFEGYCSGSGIAELAASTVEERVASGERVPWFDGRPVSAEHVARAAFAGDALAREVFGVSGKYLGRGCAMLIDILNPEVIVIGSVYIRCRELLERSMLAEIERESLSRSRESCRIVAAELGEKIGDVASLCAAMEGLNG